MNPQLPSRSLMNVRNLPYLLQSIPNFSILSRMDLTLVKMLLSDHACACIDVTTEVTTEISNYIIVKGFIFSND